MAEPRDSWAASSTRRTTATSLSPVRRSASSGSTSCSCSSSPIRATSARRRPPTSRLELAELAFDDVPEAVVELDRHARTVDSLEERSLATDTFFILGADELAGFEEWKSPQRVLELVRLAVAMRPGVARDEVVAVRRRLGAPERIVEFELDPLPISSSEIRARIRDGQPIDELVSPAVAQAISRHWLYGRPE